MTVLSTILVRERLLIYAQAWGARREDQTDLQQDVGGVVDQYDHGADADVVDAPGEGEQGERGQVVDDLLLEVLQEQQQNNFRLPSELRNLYTDFSWPDDLT